MALILNSLRRHVEDRWNRFTELVTGYADGPASIVNLERAMQGSRYGRR